MPPIKTDLIQQFKATKGGCYLVPHNLRYKEEIGGKKAGGNQAQELPITRLLVQLQETLQLERWPSGLTSPKQDFVR